MNKINNKIINKIVKNLSLQEFNKNNEWLMYSLLIVGIK